MQSNASLPDRPAETTCKIRVSREREENDLMRATYLEQLLDGLHLGRAEPPGHLRELVRASGSAERREQRAETMATRECGALFGVVGLHAGVADEADLPAQAADAGSELLRST